MTSESCEVASTGAGPRRSHAHLDDIHRLRGLTIIGIVMLHAFSSERSGLALLERRLVDLATQGDHAVYSLIADAIEVLLHDATLHFVLISGILYTRVYAHRSTLSFYRSRTLNVLVPYAIVSVLLTAFPWQLGAAPELTSLSARAFAGRVVWSILRWPAEFHLWYIPVAAVLYALSPVFHRIVVTPRLAPVGIALALAPLVVSRTGILVTPGQVVYFSGAYLIGVALGRDVATLRAVAKARFWWFALVSAAATLALVLVRARGVEMPYASLEESLFYVQKLAAFPVLLHLAGAPLARAGSAVLGLLDQLADHSLAVYLVHVTMQTAIWNLALQLVGTEVSLVTWISVSLVATGGAIALAFALVAAVRMVVGQRSRLLIGA